MTNKQAHIKTLTMFGLMCLCFAVVGILFVTFPKFMAGAFIVFVCVGLISSAYYSIYSGIKRS